MVENQNAWVRELPAEVTVCDAEGVILEMNAEAEALFAADGGAGLMSTNALDCHPQAARHKMEGLLETQAVNAYFNTENGEKRFFFQAPWYLNGEYAGFIEISFTVPEDIPHFIRG
jgi:hypothetical protein